MVHHLIQKYTQTNNNGKFIQGYVIKIVYYLYRAGLLRFIGHEGATLAKYFMIMRRLELIIRIVRQIHFARHRFAQITILLERE